MGKPVALVTGASGFVGGALARSLLRTHNVVALVRDGDAPDDCIVVRGALEDMTACERAIVNHQPEVVYHLGAQAIVGIGNRDPWSTFESNVRGTYNLLEAFRRHRPERSVMVVASSDKAYGEIPALQTAYKETDPLRGIGPYDCSKSCTDMIAQSYAEQYWLPIGIIRCGNIYGPGDEDMSRIIPSLIDDLLSYRTMQIHSDGTPIRDYTYIDDAVRAYKVVTDAMLNGAPVQVGQHRILAVPAVFNVSGNCAVSVEQLAALLHTIAEPQLNLGRMPLEKWRCLGGRSGEIQQQILDTTKIETELNFKPEFALSNGLKHTFNWWSSRRLKY